LIIVLILYSCFLFSLSTSSSAGTGGIEIKGTSVTTTTTSSIIAVSGGHFDLSESASLTITQNSALCVNGGSFSVTSPSPITIDTSSQLLVGGGSVDFPANTVLSTSSATLWLASGTVTFRSGSQLLLGSADVQIVGGKLEVIGTAQMLYQPGSWIRISAGEFHLSNLAQPFIVSGLRIDLTSFSSLTPLPQCPAMAPPLLSPGLFLVDGSTVLEVDSSGVVSVSLGTFNLTQNGAAKFKDSSFQVSQTGNMLSELSTSVWLLRSNFIVSDGGFVTIKDDAQVLFDGPSNLLLSDAAPTNTSTSTVWFTGNSLGNFTAGSTVSATGGILSADQSASLQMEAVAVTLSGLGTISLSGSSTAAIDSSTVSFTSAGGIVSLSAQVLICTYYYISISTI